MSAQEILRQVGDALGSAASVKSVFGEPIQTEGKTVVPVARIAYGFGGGFGSRHGPNGAKSDDSRGEGGGGGGGGGVHAYPAGALEISAAGTRFIQFPDLRWLATAFGAGVLFGGVILRRKLLR